jgi:hypothetical protein
MEFVCFEIWFDQMGVVYRCLLWLSEIFSVASYIYYQTYSGRKAQTGIFNWLVKHLALGSCLEIFYLILVLGLNPRQCYMIGFWSDVKELNHLFTQAPYKMKTLCLFRNVKCFLYLLYSRYRGSPSLNVVHWLLL